MARNTLANFHRRQWPTVAFDLLPEALHTAGSPDPPSETLRRDEVERLLGIARGSTVLIPRPVEVVLHREDMVRTSK